MSEPLNKMESPSNASIPGDVLVKNRQGGQEADWTKRVSRVKDFDFEGWKISMTQSTIMPSNCYCTTLNGASSVSNCDSSNKSNNLCSVCRFEKEVKLKHLPEMVFPENILRVEYKDTGFVLEFNAIDAIKQISESGTESIRVACAEEWKAAQEHKDLSNHIDYDWTFATTYKGTLHSASGSEGDLCATPTSEKLNLEKLKEREKILFFEELNLYEDELHDNGTSNLCVKIRVMPSGFFILLRFFLRVDNVMVNIRDTRFHYEVGNSFFLREYQERRQSAAALAHLSPQIFCDPNLIYQHLPVIHEVTERINLN